MSVLENDFDADVEEYNANMAAQLGEDYEKFARYKVVLTKHLISDKTEKILNYGCGIGNDMNYFKQLWPAAELYGCDISQKSIEYAKKNYHDVHFFQSDSPEKIYEQKTKWDIVFLACVLHHIPPEERTMWMKAVADNVSDGGYICVFEHNVINPMTKRIVTHPIEYPALDKLEWMLSLKDIESLLVGSHSRMETFWKGYVLFSPIRNDWITRAETVLKWCPLGAQQCVIVKKKG